MREARRGRREKAGSTISQLPWQSVRNPYAPMELLSPDQMQDLHDTSISILKDLGIKVMGANVRALFARAGARIDDGDIVRIDESLVTEALKTAPRQFALTPRNPAKRLGFGSGQLVFGLVAGPPNVHDRVNGRRAGSMGDYRNFIRLAQHFNAIHMIGNQVTAPQELPANNRHLDTYFANLTLSDLTYHCTAIGRGRALDGIRMMAISRGVSLEDMAQEPGVITVISVNSPRLLDDAMGDGLDRHGRTWPTRHHHALYPDGGDDPGQPARRLGPAKRRGPVWRGVVPSPTAHREAETAKAHRG